MISEAPQTTPAYRLTQSQRTMLRRLEDLHPSETLVPITSTERQTMAALVRLDLAQWVGNGGKAVKP